MPILVHPTDRVAVCVTGLAQHRGLRFYEHNFYKEFAGWIDAVKAHNMQVDPVVLTVPFMNCDSIPPLHLSAGFILFKIICNCKCAQVRSRNVGNEI